MFGPGHPAQLVLGWSIWATWFVVLYGGLGAGCALALPAVERGAATWINGSLGLITLATLMLLLWLAWRCWRFTRMNHEDVQSARFVAPVSAASHLAAAVATLAVGLPILVLPPCL